MNQLILALLLMGSWLDALVRYAAFFQVRGSLLVLVLARDFRDLLDAFAAMATPPTQSA